MVSDTKHKTKRGTGEYLPDLKVRWNQIADNADAGIFVVDHSLADLEGNHVRSVLPGPLGTAYGIKGDYYAEITLGSNTIDLEPPYRVVLMYNATIEP
jgi:hypothetical protein